MTEILEKTGLVERSGQGVDKIFSITLSEGKTEPDQPSIQISSFTINNLTDVLSLINQVSAQINIQASIRVKEIVNDQVNPKVFETLSITTDWSKRAKIFEKLSLGNQTKNRIKYLDPLIDYGWIKLTNPETPTSPNQRYRITESGKRLLNILKPTKNI